MHPEVIQDRTLITTPQMEGMWRASVVYPTLAVYHVPRKPAEDADPWAWGALASSVGQASRPPGTLASGCQRVRAHLPPLSCTSEAPRVCQLLGTPSQERAQLSLTSSSPESTLAAAVVLITGGLAQGSPSLFA